MENNPFALLSGSASTSESTSDSHSYESPAMSASDRSGMRMSTLVEGSTLWNNGSSIGPMPTDDNGYIIHEGLLDPGFILDCMAWDLMDDYTGVWKSEQIPPRHYFNCLRFCAWASTRDPNPPSKIRDIPLPKKEVIERIPDVHKAAMEAAYGLWAEEYFGHQKSQMFGARPLPAPIGPPNGRVWDSLQAQDSLSALQSPSPNSGGVPLYSGFQSNSPEGYPDYAKSTIVPGRADSVITGTDTWTTALSDRRGTAFSSTSSGSPVKHMGHVRQLSALAASFSPGAMQGNSSLSSRGALPTLPGQLPGTFDVLAQHDKRKFVCLVVTEVPFNVTINEILTHLKLGEREGLVQYGPDNPGIHIIQDRSDSKTHEVYVEMLNHEVANRVIRDIPRRGIKIGSTGGSRKIRVEVCSQEVMMRAIFPRPTKSHPWQFHWMGYDPDLNTIPDSFIGFVSPEDLHNSRDWAEHPRKAKHADDAPQRVYEFMISTLVHLPKTESAYGNLKGWRDVQDFVDRLFGTVVAMIRTLNSMIDDPKFAERHLKREHVHLLNFRLLKRFNQTCFDFPLFSNAQKEQLLLGV